MDPYGTLYRHLLWPAWERGVKRRSTLSRWALLEEVQWEPQNLVRTRQCEGLRHLLKHARLHVPYYRDVFASVGFDPNRLRDVTDLAAIPPLTKALGRAHHQRLVDPRTRSSHVQVTSKVPGARGVPFPFEYDQNSDVWRAAVRLRGFGWAGHRPGSRSLVYGGPSNTLPGLGGARMRLDRRLRRETHVDCLRQDEASLREVVETIRSRRPEFIVGFSAATAMLARFVTNSGLRDWRDIRVICGAERLMPNDREAIRLAFGGAIFETYGVRETMLLAAECDEHAGLHTMDDAHVVEVVVGNRPARPGEIGEVLVTDLHNYGMPLIRYRNGDLAVPETDAPCGCGRGFARLRKVMGIEALSQRPEVRRFGSSLGGDNRGSFK